MNIQNANRREITKPVLVMIFGIFAVSTASILIRFAQNQAPSLVIAAARLTIASLLLAPWGLRAANREEIRVLGRKRIGLAVLSGLFLAVHFAAWITSLEHTSVASSVVLVTTTPLWVALLSPIVLKETLKPGVWVGMLLALAGGVIIALTNSCEIGLTGIRCPAFGEFFRGKAMYGNFLALIGALMASGYILAGRQIRPALSLVSYTFLVYGTASILLLVFVFISGQSFVGYSPMTYFWFAALAVVPQLLGHSSFNYALRYVPAAFVSVALLGEPVGSIILAFIFLKEFPAEQELAGGVLILLGIYLVTRATSGKSSSE